MIIRFNEGMRTPRNKSIDQLPTKQTYRIEGSKLDEEAR